MVHVGYTVIVEDLEFDEKLRLPDRRLPGGRPHERHASPRIPPLASALLGRKDGEESRRRGPRRCASSIRS
ncbi:MAG: hypothetical protein ACLUNZ_10715 [Evtepia sp.]